MAWMDISNMIKESKAWITILLRTIPILVDKNLYFGGFKDPLGTIHSPGGQIVILDPGLVVT